MEINLSSDLIAAIGDEVLEKFGFRSHGRSWGLKVSLPKLPVSQLQELKQTVEATKLPGRREVTSMISRYLELVSGKAPKAGSAKQLHGLLNHYIATQCPNYRLYRAIDGHWLAFHIEACNFVDERVVSGERQPAYITLKLSYVAFGKIHNHSITAQNSECRTTAAIFLAKRGICCETDSLLEKYNQSHSKYLDLVDRTGTQCLATGFGYVESRWGRSEGPNTATSLGSSDTNLGVNGGTKVVVDVLHDDETEVINSRQIAVAQTADTYGWELLKKLYETGNNEDFDVDDADHELDEEILEKSSKLFIPVHPLISVFDLQRHSQCTVHVDDLQVYEYDTDIHNKLILPEDVKSLVRILASSQGEKFADVVEGKSGGTTVLLAGPPGVGKTLTAEVFCETVQRPLYRVQCSQLGTDPDDLEAELLKVFSRANRWKAIILLDEADVYIRRRGDDLAVNAIVGVFLRVLEYQSTVLFLTTNLPESVDDAIASRCIARIDYTTPTKEDLIKIWKVLSATSGIAVGDSVIEQAVDEYPFMSGRDVKNALKLISVRKEKVTIEEIREICRFHPNRGNWIDVTLAHPGRWEAVNNVISNGHYRIEYPHDAVEAARQTAAWLNHGGAIGK